jgi:hypothetical protein
MADSGGPDPHGPMSTPAATGHHDADSNPEVSYERSDVEARGVVWFVSVLALMLVVLSFFLYGLYQVYESREADANKLQALPLSTTDRDRLPAMPRLEGIDPTRDAGRAWPATVQAEGPLPWFGYNARVVPLDGPRDPGSDAEERDRLAALAMARTLEKVDAKLSELAGKLPARHASLPPDAFRRSAGDGNAGRSAVEKSP